MRILIISQRFFPENFRINDIAVALVDAGNDVTVLTGLPNYPTGKVPEQYKHLKNRYETIRGVKIIRTFEIGRKPGTWGLGKNYLSLALSSSWKSLFLRGDYDVIFVYQLSPVFCLLPAYILKKRKHIPLFAYSCDLWPESLKAYNVREDQLLFRVIKRMSRWLYAQCDLIAVSSPPFIKYLQEILSLKNEMVYMPQHAEEVYLSMDLDAAPSSKVRFLFCGNIGKVQEVSCILKAVSIIDSTNDFRVDIVGDGSELNNCKRLSLDLGIEKKVSFHGRRPLTEMPTFYKRANVCLLTLIGGNFIGMTIPSKLQGYMAAGKMIIAATDGAAKEIIEEAKCGLSVKAGDYIGLARLMTDYINQKDQFSEYGKRGRLYFKEHFTQEIFMNNLTNLLKSLGEIEHV